MKQLEFAFPSLDFPGTPAIAPQDIAARLNVSLPQVYKWMEQGEFAAIDVSRADAERKTWRIPVESYRDFVCRRMTGPKRYELLRQLPRETLRSLQADIARILA